MCENTIEKCLTNLFKSSVTIYIVLFCQFQKISYYFIINVANLNYKKTTFIKNLQIKLNRRIRIRNKTYKKHT